MRKHPTALLYSPDSIGLGHMQRHMAISSQLVAMKAKANALMMVGSGAGAFFEQPDGVDTIKLPSVQKVGADCWQSRSLDIPAGIARELRSSLIRKTVQVLKPEVLVVDHLPAGVWGELIPTLKMIRAAGGRTKVILGLRDIIDSPERLIPRWEEEGCYEILRAYYDQILIYGNRDIYPSARLYGLEQEFDGRISYCDYVCSAQPQAGADASSTGRKADGKRLIVITAGGGHDAFPMMKASLDALRRLQGRSDWRAILITGPLMPMENRLQLQQRVAGMPVEFVAWAKDIKAHLGAADVIVTMGGYNSVLETVCLAKPAIVIPRTGPSNEQRIRARLFSELGLLSYIDLEGLTAKRLAGEIDDLLSGKPLAASLLDMSGAARAANRIAATMHAGTKPVRRPRREPADRSVAAIG